MTQHIGTLKLRHIRTCQFCKDRLELMRQGYTDSQVIRISKERRVQREARTNGE